MASSLQASPCALSSVAFGMYSPEEVRRISVCQVDSPVMFDNLNNALVGGLYDPAMGPIDQLGRCATCGCSKQKCPGHFGRIELPVPCYAPLQFGALVKVLQASCEHCGRFRLEPRQVARYARRFEALACGDLVRSLEAEAVRGGEGSDDEGSDSDDMDEREDGGRQGKPACEPNKEGSSAPLSKLVQDQYTSLAGSFLRVCASGMKCGACGMFNAKVKQEGSSKIFCKALTEKQARANAILSDKGDVEVDDMGGEEDEEEEEEDEERGSGSDGTDDEVALVELGAKKAKNKKAPTDKAKAPARVAAASKPVFLTADVARERVRRLWKMDNAAARHVWGGAAVGMVPGAGADCFFLEALLVAPNQFRPPSQMGDLMFEHPMNTSLKACLEACLRVRDVARALRSAAGEAAGSESEGGAGPPPPRPQAAPWHPPRPPRNANGRPFHGEGEDSYAMRRPPPSNQQWVASWQTLQSAVNGVLDSEKSDSDAMGVRQVLEKKEGLFRKNMMGKRVNFAARSVISPDPLIAPNEIGVPAYVAEGLTYPERVGAHNEERLRAAVINGPRHYPGATHVEDARGHTIDLSRLSRERRTNLAKTLGAAVSERADGQTGVPFAKVVHRHLRDGDMMLVNRQPTLHRPSLMAHRARVLLGQRTIRMHYSNCSSYNADFDGDEINLHLPQDEIARTEASEIVNADQQYIVPTSGGPIRGLIQDHVVMSVALTRRDCLLDAERFQMLLYAACSSAPPTDYGHEGKVREISEEYLQMPPPAMLKPRRMWTGKQLLSAVLAHCGRGRAPMTMEAGAKLSGALWGDAVEGRVIVRQGQLLTGVFDKAQYGRGGIVHAFQELYGCEAAGRLLHSFSKLFTHMLAWKGFSCGMEDLNLTPQHEDARTRELEAAQTAGEGVARETLRKAGAGEKGRRGTGELAVALGRHVRQTADAEVALDMAMTGALAPVSSAAVKACLPHGAERPFPDNQMAMMTSSGAKGSMVNSSQISVLLGQQELEGRRPPRMASGKTLPCFSRFDPAARAGGFVGDRFLSGLRPPEYVFHAMAGREGLVDTTVKTSRSGYLQRCLIKCLEGLRVGYDYSVRDQDGSLVQFRYGEDGVDPTAAAYLSAKHLPFIARNAAVYREAIGEDAEPPVAGSEAERARGELRDERRKRAMAGADGRRQEPPLLGERSPAEALGIMSESFAEGLDSYVKADQDGLLGGATTSSDCKKKKKKTKQVGAAASVSKAALLAISEAKYMRSLAPPGEAVGVIASQSIGEPSTQMTLNTFHFAGRGEANVTMGIPRLREIFMSASASIGLPVMTVPMRAGTSEAEAKAVAGRLSRLALASVVDGVAVREVLLSADAFAGGRARKCEVTLRLRPRRRWPREAALSWPKLERAVRDGFAPQLLQLVKKELKAADGQAKIFQDAVSEGGADEGAARRGGKKAAAAAEEVAARRAKAKAAKRREKHGDDADEELDETELDATEARARADGREGGGYDARDEEDVAAEAEERRRRKEKADGDADFDTEGEGEGGSDSDSGEGEAAAGGGKSRARRQQEAHVVLSGTGGDTPTATVTFSVPASSSRILLLPLAQQAAVKAAVRETLGIKRAFTVAGKGDESGRYKLQTDGVNFTAAWKLAEQGADIDGVTSNDIAAMLRVYGVEAARATLVNEVSGVFGAYGIGVDPRHLGLVADYMTFEGDYRACSRLGIRSCTSPMLKMSFETAMSFVRDAALRAESDSLESPSARIIVGRTVGSGTGMCKLRYDVGAAAEMLAAQSAKA